MNDQIKQQLLLVSDYHINDPYMGFMKSEIHQKCPTLRIIDLAHGVPYSDISLAAYYIKGFLSFGRSGNIIITSVNNYYCNDPEFIVFEKDGNYFLGPDNGVLSLVFENYTDIDVYKIDLSKIKENRLEEIYSHAVACIHHNLPLDEIGDQKFDAEAKMLFHPVVTSSTIRATIIHVDGYENIITNLTRSTFEKARDGRDFLIYYNPKAPINQLSNHYGQVEVGEVVCLFNRANHLEIGINQGKASSMLHLFKNETIQIDFL